MGENTGEPIEKGTLTQGWRQAALGLIRARGRRYDVVSDQVAKITCPWCGHVFLPSVEAARVSAEVDANTRQTISFRNRLRAEAAVTSSTVETMPPPDMRVDPGMPISTILPGSSSPLKETAA